MSLKHGPYVFEIGAGRNAGIVFFRPFSADYCSMDFIVGMNWFDFCLSLSSSV